MENAEEEERRIVQSGKSFLRFLLSGEKDIDTFRDSGRPMPGTLSIQAQTTIRGPQQRRIVQMASCSDEPNTSVHMSVRTPT